MTESISNQSILVSTSAPAWLQPQLETGQYTTRQIQQITLKRNKRVENYLHQTSSLIVKRLVDEQIGQLVIGKNEKWKQNVELGKKTVPISLS
jgi:hypothetical protein